VSLSSASFLLACTTTCCYSLNTMGHLSIAKHVSFLSYNLYCLPWLATMFSPSSCPLSSQRSAKFLEHVTSYDILALQEVWDPRYRQVEKYARLNNMHVVGSSAPSVRNYLKLRFFGGGLMIISKYPIVDHQELVFESGTSSDGFVTKGVLYAKVQVGPSSFVHVFNTHLQASYGYEFDFKTNPFASIRKKQLHKLASFIKKVTSSDHHPIVVMGDFNVNARRTPTDGGDSEEYIDMLNILHSEEVYDVVDVLKHFNDGQHPVTYGGQGVRDGHNSVGGQRLDFLFEMRKKGAQHSHKFTKGHVVPFDVKEEVFTHISDHFGATALMEVHVTEESIEVEERDANGASLAHASISLTA